jgi:pyridoxine kinase
VVLDAVARVKAANPRAVYCCDPVMGDTGRGFFVRPGIPEFMRDHVIPRADIATPNHFELDFLTGRAERSTTMAAVLDAVDDLRAMGPSTVLVTSLVHDGMSPDTLEVLAADDAGAWLVSTPLLPISVNGAGDLTSALFLAHLLETRSAATALARTASSVWGVLEETARSGEREIQIVAAQECIAHPDERFEVLTLR